MDKGCKVEFNEKYKDEAIKWAIKNNDLVINNRLIETKKIFNDNNLIVRYDSNNHLAFEKYYYQFPKRWFSIIEKTTEITNIKEVE